MMPKCPRCQVENTAGARFCARCGQALSSNENVAGRLLHPKPLSPPEGFTACAQAAALFYRWEAAWGGSVLLSTESLRLVLFNGGYGLRSVMLQIHGHDEGGRDRFAFDHVVEDLPRGEQREIEIASYELPDSARELTVSLVSAEFGENE